MPVQKQFGAKEVEEPLNEIMVPCPNRSGSGINTSRTRTKLRSLAVLPIVGLPAVSQT